MEGSYGQILMRALIRTRFVARDLQGAGEVGADDGDVVGETCYRLEESVRTEC